MKEYINISKRLSEQNSPKNRYFNENTEKRKNNKKISLSQLATSGILDSAQEKYTLSKLINSVTNYRKETGTDFKIDVASIKPNKLFHVDSYNTIGVIQPHHRTSFIEKTKLKSISPFKDNNNFNNSVIDNNNQNEEKNPEKTKKSLIDYFPIDKLIKLETKFIILISKIKNINQLREEFIVWINEFKNSPFYEFQFIFKNIFDNESPIKENTSNLIKNSSNLLIISNIICFIITDKYIINNINITKFDNIDIKYIYELMINNHKLYLLICLFILIEENLINENDNVYVLRLIEQIKAYLAKTLRNFKNRLLILNEIKSVTKKLVTIINKVIMDLEPNFYYSEELLEYSNNLNKIEISRLFEIFELIKNRNYLNNIIDNNNILYQNNNINNINNISIQTQTQIQNDNQYNIYSKRNFYKKIGKINENKNQLKNNNSLYIKKNVPNRQINNKKVTNKIINIIINNNNSNPNINYDNQNSISVNYGVGKNKNKNNNKNNNNNDTSINYDNQNNFAINYNLNKKHNFNRNQNLTNNLTQEYDNNNEQMNSILFNLNNSNKNNYNHKYNNNINNLSLYKTMNYNNYFNNNIQRPENDFNYTINNKKYSTINANYNTNNDFYNYNNNDYLLNQVPIRIIPLPEPPFLPPKKNKSEISPKKFTLILDLDETLVRYKINENNPDEAKVIFRPGLFYFLNKVYPLFDIVIWTVATKEYADPIIDIIEENKKYFIARLFRHHATIKNNTYIKDLTNLGRDINTIIIIDDKETSFSFQKQNGILIKPFYGTYLELKNDFILYDLFKILTKIILDKSNDVREGINKYQYEIKQKITKDFNKNNFDNVKEENNGFFNNKNISINNNNNTINNINNKTLKNSVNHNNNPKYEDDQKINRCYSMSDSLGFNNTYFSKK